MWTEDTVTHTINALRLGAIPAICMIIFTLIGLGREVPSNIAGALQHFAAGILLCTIGTELLPTMVEAETTNDNIAMTVGFFLGVFVMISLGIFMPEAEEEDDDDDDKEEEERDENSSTEAVGYSSSPLQLRGENRSKSIFDEGIRMSTSHRKCNRLSLITAAKQHKEGCVGVGTTLVLSEEPQEVDETSTLLNNNKASTTTTNATTPNKPFPTTLLLAIAIDSAMDGILIGIASVAGPSAGPMMSLSLTVEMSFLGLTLATALQGYDSKKTLPATFLGPIVLVLGAAIGGMLASMLLDHHSLFTGLLSFGASALLYMVAEELLLEAHEDDDDGHVWWVDLQLYVGFWASVMLGKVVDMASS